MRVEKTKKRITLIIFLTAILVGGRAYLPTAVKQYSNRLLGNMPDYRGHIDDVDLHLWRGAYGIKGFELKKINGQVPVPFIRVPKIDFSIEWRPLLKGHLVGRITADHMTVNVVAAEDPEKRQTALSKEWVSRLKDLFPLRINRLQIKNGEVHFRELQAKPPVHIFLQHLDMTVFNLTNSKNVSRTLKATLEAKALAMNSGWMEAYVGLDPFAQKPTFSVRFKLEKLGLPSLNTFLNHYLAVEARTGTLDFYLEGEAQDGSFEGYAKPLLNQLDVIRIKENATLKEFFKGIAVKLISYNLKNHPQNRLGSRIPIQGTVEQPDPDTWKAITSFLKNWLIKALSPGFEA